VSGVCPSLTAEPAGGPGSTRDHVHNHNHTDYLQAALSTMLALSHMMMVQAASEVTGTLIIIITRLEVAAGHCAALGSA
jgi:hypothetical protein